MENRLDVIVTPEWAAYRAGLLGLVGDDDPAEVQAATPDLLRRRVEAASAAGVLRERPAPSEWSVLGLVGHLLDGEIFASARYRWILGHDAPTMQGYDQDLVADASGHDDADVDILLGAWEGLRRANLALWARSTPEQRLREGVHAERGPSTYDILFREIAGHDRFHLEQMDRTLAAVARGWSATLTSLVRTRRAGAATFRR
jgi:hypothetical protein